MKVTDVIGELGKVLARPNALDTVPLTDEAFRPMLKLLAEIGRNHGPHDTLVGFDEPSDYGDDPEQLYLAAPVFVGKLQEVIEVYTPRICKAWDAVPDSHGPGVMKAIQVGPDVALLYCPAVRVPLAALGRARH